jgi:arylsulfatase A-like enzyme
MQKRIIIAVALAVLIAGAVYAATGTRLFKTPPNIVIILTDDMDMKLMPYMEKTNELIGGQGATFTNYFITTPICCPSRTSMLRGQYSHNTDIMENSPGFARFFKLGEEESTLAVWLNEGGYETSMIGKYLNVYPTNAGWSYVPPGWTDWHAFLNRDPGDDFYFDYVMNENGEITEYGNSLEEYSTDVILAKSIDFINNNSNNNSPFFLLVSVYAPHGPSTPAPRHEETFADIEYPQGPSFNEEDISDKPQIIQTLGSTGDEFDISDANNLFRKRVQSVQAVDELVAEVIKTLEENGQLESTYIFFLSDNGFHMAEHRFPSGKGMPYEEDIHVLFMLRGPGIQPGTQVTQLIANIDIAPTIADMANVDAADFVDGRSFLPILKTENGTVPDWRKGLLIEIGYISNDPFSLNPQNISLSSTEDIPVFVEYPDSKHDEYLAQAEGGSFRGFRTETYLYAEYENGELEFYDLTTDPYQMENIAATLDPELLARLHFQLESLKTCTAETCRALENELTAELK